jgi:hypothetical protein
MDPETEDKDESETQEAPPRYTPVTIGRYGSHGCHAPKVGMDQAADD